MRFVFTALCCFGLQTLMAQARFQDLPIYSSPGAGALRRDWLLHPPDVHSGVFRKESPRPTLVLTNGLVERVFDLGKSVTCISFKNLGTGEEMIRSPQPEARLEISGQRYFIGGLKGQSEQGYFLEKWLETMQPVSEDFAFVDFSTQPLQPLLFWKRRAWAQDQAPAHGVEIAFRYRALRPELRGLWVEVHYALYDGLPLVSKWLVLRNQDGGNLKIDRVVHEVLAVPEEESAVVGETSQMRKPHGIYVESDYAFNNAMRYDLSDQTLHWKADSSYTSQVNYEYKTPCLMEIYVEKGPGVQLRAADTLRSVRSFELLLDSYDRERRGLSIRRMYRVIAPWTNQNPIFMHLVSHRDEEVLQAVDQCAATGYEALILSFGSHCQVEDTSEQNIQKWKTLADYAHRHHILIGGYSLFSSREISPEDDVIDPLTGKPDAGAFFGHAPCYGSRWGLAYLQKIKTFFSRTGFDVFENDGPYPGDQCASKVHPGHEGLDDSQWRQMTLQKSLYHWCASQGIYVNAPDWYFLDGTNKIALGYREVNFSLPRENQKLLNRQNIFDGTWEKNSSMSWGFVPLTKYQGGGPEAVLEPLVEHLADYRQLMMQYYGAGVQACYRGPRLYDTEKTRQEVTNVIGWYKKYRQVFNGDLIHLRRADGRDWDGWMLVAPHSPTKALLMVFNPLDEEIVRSIRVPLYYSGLQGHASFHREGQTAQPLDLDAGAQAILPVHLAPHSFTWYAIY